MEFFDDRSTRYALVKKGGSSTLGASLRPEAVGGQPIHRFVVLIRHPKARLLSGYIDLVKTRGFNPCRVPKSEHTDFYRFAKSLCTQSDEAMDHHFAPQVHSIQGVIDKTPMQPYGQLFIGTLEALDDHLWPKLEFFKGKTLTKRRRRESNHEAWQTYYDPNKQKGRNADALVEERYAADLALWRLIDSMGGWFEHQWGLNWLDVWAGLLRGEKNFDPSVDKRSALL